MQFYIYFLTPIRIATKYRLTQEVTPAATIVATTIASTYMTSKAIRYLIKGSLLFYDFPYVMVIIPMSLHIIAMIFLSKFLCEEWREEKARKNFY